MSTDLLKEKADKFAHEAYALSRKLPKDEVFGLSSQLKRAAMSVPLNIIEGYARQSAKSEKQFIKIAYGSLKESMYLVKFSKDEGFFSNDETSLIEGLGDELGRMLWSKAKTLEKSTQ